MEVTKLIRIDDGINYCITQDEQGYCHKILQLIISSEKTITVDQGSICWCSESIKLKSKGSFLSRFLSSTNQSLSIAHNDGSGSAIVCISHNFVGDIIILKPSLLTGFYCFKDSFLSATNQLTVESKLLPLNAGVNVMTLMYPQIMTSVYLVKLRDPTDGSFFAQSCGSIMKKVLKSGESLNVSISCMVAFEESCKLSPVNIAGSVVNTIGTQLMLRVEGPGAVYFSLKKPTSMTPLNGMRGGAPYGQLSNVGLMLHFITVILSFYTLSMLLLRMEFQINMNEFGGAGNFQPPDHLHPR